MSKETGMSLEEMKPFLPDVARVGFERFSGGTGDADQLSEKVEEQIASLQQVVDFIQDKLEQRSMYPDRCSLEAEHLVTGLSKRKIFLDGMCISERYGEKRGQVMTLQQLKYVIEVATHGSMNEAAKRLFISQPSLSNAIRDLEQELSITNFERTNKGITLSKEGVEFLSYARQVVEQAELLENRYLNAKPSPQHFRYPPSTTLLP